MPGQTLCQRDPAWLRSPSRDRLVDHPRAFEVNGASLPPAVEFVRMGRQDEELDMAKLASPFLGGLEL